MLKNIVSITPKGRYYEVRGFHEGRLVRWMRPCKVSAGLTATRLRSNHEARQKKVTNMSDQQADVLRLSVRGTLDVLHGLMFKKSSVTTVRYTLNDKGRAALKRKKFKNA